MVNGIDELAVTNLDGLDTVETIRFCIGYRDGTKSTTWSPMTLSCGRVQTNLRGISRLAGTDANGEEVEQAAGQSAFLPKGNRRIDRRETGDCIGRPGTGDDFPPG